MFDQMLRKTLLFLFMFVTAILPTFLSAEIAFATSPSGFSPKAVIPENQVDKGKTYFDIRLAPEGRQTLFLEVSNTEQYPLEITVDLNNAKTGQDGIIYYPQSDERDESLKYAATDCARVIEATKRIEPATTAIFEIEIQMPIQKFDGIILGGLVVSATYPEEVAVEEEAQNATVGVENRYEYVVGLQISETDAAVKHALSFNTVDARLVNLHPYVIANIQNATPSIIGRMDISLKVFREGSSQVLREKTLYQVAMAPQSHGDFAIPWGEQTFEPGKYRFEMTVTTPTDQWSFEENFTVSAQQARTVNEGSVIYGASLLPIWVYVTITALLMVVSLLFYMVLKKRKLSTIEDTSDDPRSGD